MTDIVERINSTVSAWMVDEPEADWWNYQRDHKEAATEITSLRADLAKAVEGLEWISDHSTERPCMTSTEHIERTLDEVQSAAQSLIKELRP